MNELGDRAGGRRGFTLVELLAVIAIIITLMGIVVAGAGYAQRAADRARAKTQLQSLCKAMDNYKVEIGTYPSTMDTNTAPGRKVWNALLTNSVDKTVNKIEYVDPWGKPWNYRRDARAGYVIWSDGADGSNGTPDDVSNKMVE